MAHSFGRTVSAPKHMKNEVGDGPSGICVLLHCQCMNQKMSKMHKPWYKGEYEILTEKEYQMLVRYHDETCNVLKETECQMLVRYKNA